MSNDNPIVDYENLAFGNLTVEPVDRSYSRILSYLVLGSNSLATILLATETIDTLQRNEKFQTDDLSFYLYLVGATMSILAICLQTRKNNLEKLVAGVA